MATMRGPDCVAKVSKSVVGATMCGALLPRIRQQSRRAQEIGRSNRWPA